MKTLADEYIPRPGEFDPLADAEEPARRNGKPPAQPLIEFFSPSQLRQFETPPDHCLAGDNFIQRGAISVLAGPPGTGKSRASLWLALAGAKGIGNWLGLDVQCQFRTLVLQSENGAARLARDFRALSDMPTDLDDSIRISAPGAQSSFPIANKQFIAEMKAAIRDFEPDLIQLDPLNAWARGALEEDFRAGLDKLQEVAAESPKNPAILIVHHLRKPKAEDRHRGRSLAYLMAGSYVINSAPRSGMVLMPGSDDLDDDTVIASPVKNNDGEWPARTAWKRCVGEFEPIPDYDWETYDAGGESKTPASKVKEEHLREVFKDGERWLRKSEAVQALEELTGAKRTACYKALELEGGRFSHLLYLSQSTGTMTWRPNAGETS